MQEWIAVKKPTYRDNFCLRLSSRCNVRPLQPEAECMAERLSVGDAVEVKWHDGWWEAVVLRAMEEGTVAVYLLGKEN